MKKALKTKAAMALAILPAPVMAQTAPAPVPAPTPATAQTVDADPALWVVRDDDTTIYLLGTIHVLKPGLSWFDEGVRKAFDDSDEVVLEMVMPDAQAMQGLIQTLAVNPTGPTLPDKLPADKREAYARAVASVGLPANAFDRLDPWFASTNLGLLPLLKLGYDPTQGVEPQITAAALTANKPVTGLETAAEQLGFFDNLPEAAQIRMLTSTIDQMDEFPAMIDTMVTSWSRGDPDRLATLMNDSLRDTPEVSKVLLTDRNERWAGWIQQRMAQPGVVFMAVGAGHLAGPDSVQAKLANRKLTATRVRY